MTQHKWLTSTHLRALMVLARDQIDERRLRLFACACCRNVWNRFIDPHTVGIVALAEEFADGKVSEAAFARVRERANAAVVRAEQAPGTPTYLIHVARAAARACTDDINTGGMAACLAALHAVADFPATGGLYPEDLPPECREEMATQADLFRDIFGPDPASSRGDIDPAWLTSDVRALAQSIYANRDFGAMPILADALQDAGCDDDDILTHCREAPVHARGCWVVEMLL